jgi:hypothetical protein
MHFLFSFPSLCITSAGFIFSIITNYKLLFFINVHKYFTFLNTSSCFHRFYFFLHPKNILLLYKGPEQNSELVIRVQQILKV